MVVCTFSVSFVANVSVYQCTDWAGFSDVFCIICFDFWNMFRNVFHNVYYFHVFLSTLIFYCATRPGRSRGLNCAGSSARACLLEYVSVETANPRTAKHTLLT